VSIKYDYETVGPDELTVLGIVADLDDTGNYDADSLDGKHGEDILRKDQLQELMDEKVNRFTTTTALVTPIILSPANGASNIKEVIIEISVKDSWNVDIDLIQKDLYWDVEIATDSAFTNIFRSIYNDAANLPVWRPDLLDNTTYYARARIIQNGIKSNWSPIVTFTTGTTQYAKITNDSAKAIHREDNSRTSSVPVVRIPSANTIIKKNVGNYIRTEISVFKNNKRAMKYGSGTPSTATTPPDAVWNDVVTNSTSGISYILIDPTVLEADTEYYCKIRYVYQGTSGISEIKTNATGFVFKTKKYIRDVSHIQLPTYFTKGLYTGPGVTIQTTQPPVGKIDSTTIVMQAHISAAETILYRMEVKPEGFVPYRVIPNTNGVLQQKQALCYLASGQCLMIDTSTLETHILHLWGAVQQVGSLEAVSTPSNRKHPGLVRLYNGDIYAIYSAQGGVNDKKLMKFDTTTNTWSSAGLNQGFTKRDAFTIAAIDERYFMVFGGYNPDDNTRPTFAEIYDSVDNQWSMTPTIPQMAYNYAYNVGNGIPVELYTGIVAFVGVETIQNNAATYVWDNHKQTWTFYITDDGALGSGGGGATLHPGEAYGFSGYKLITSLVKVEL